ncbi:hypothetical protein [Halorhabdus salina]|uniref:hypothetical protein n=1 Tax=Halorhabdus salina TaxID=2750670 RepID=UPI0015EE936F|nr:hypothetical protein [Halorhabdus salina]
MSRAASKRAGEAAEATVIQRVPELAPAPGRSEHVDAETETVFVPHAEVPTVGLPVVERGTPVEIKSCGVVATVAQSHGRFYLRKRQHAHLVDVSGVYLFAVTTPHDADVLALKFVPATVVGEAIAGWVEPDGRADYAQLAWTRVFDQAEVDDAE